jgi:hypothetical protein
MRGLVGDQHLPIDPVGHPDDLRALFGEDGVRETAIFEKVHTNTFARHHARPLPNQLGSSGVGSVGHASKALTD